MRKPCGTSRCWRWLEEMGLSEEDLTDEVCARCGFDGPMFQWYASR